ncbi:hypothetical protein [Streptomyces sp. CC208A]|uniref:hypothetical protein n=1 Tax=Streptomyces sp. CC208A TaxID=3044573 RepID=UPI0024A8A141|nr:hypothetical protein [Streptomyces sp. CC208A]
MDETRLRGELREAALAHRPDRARMLARVERGMAAPPPRRDRTPARALWAGRRWTATVAVATTVAAVVGLGGLAAATLRDRPASPALPAPTAPAPTAPAPTVSASTAPVPPVPAPTAPTSTAPTSTAPAPTTPTTPTTPTAPGPAASAAGTIDAGSHRWWAQSDLAVTTDTEVTGLTVELRVALTGGIATTGHWQTRPAEDFTVTVAEESGALVYRWTLKEGRTVPAGPHTFAAQYNHAEGTRDASADAYTVVLTGPDGGRTTLRGGFA